MSRIEFKHLHGSSLGLPGKKFIDKEIVIKNYKLESVENIYILALKLCVPRISEYGIKRQKKTQDKHILSYHSNTTINGKMKGVTKTKKELKL